MSANGIVCVTCLFTDKHICSGQHTHHYDAGNPERYVETAKKQVYLSAKQTYIIYYSHTYIGIYDSNCLKYVCVQPLLHKDSLYDTYTENCMPVPDG